VDQVKVDIVETQSIQAFLERSKRRVVTLILIPEFRGNKEILASDARRADALSDLCLVAVNRSGVDVPVAGAKGGSDRKASDVWRRLPNTKSDLRD
jgi:hypothetical protein